MYSFPLFITRWPLPNYTPIFKDVQWFTFFLFKNENKISFKYRENLTKMSESRYIFLFCSCKFTNFFLGFNFSIIVDSCHDECMVFLPLYYMNCLMICDKMTCTTLWWVPISIEYEHALKNLSSICKTLSER